MERQGKRECLARVPWNKLSLPEEAAVLAAARESPEWSSRQLATWITDHHHGTQGAEGPSADHTQSGPRK
ncbi:MAG: helix-turn-helix domain-containing protein [SAR324 cluster bacterium]|nr:helix-turn-helix domain-containing protein [SAR324 cluster bacterium]